MRILVLGVGNILLTDETIGVRIVGSVRATIHSAGLCWILDGGTAEWSCLATWQIAII